ncbi:hypothetical protein SpiGrapes_0813 [Sphaerochaeta pleomorpha str. Grapes]|uniref:Cytochrome b561 domain-containing protein n=1 Tax=Sphaerochaeta pleomorpha (strain ATCC BAA-1885 / DSM 22778 / Grapes) TaxID=158190 RepID=G8QQ64_SPHPG|nr:hypothetical protein [Sphaerochaeta pleomorpha]AEV28641.1 hypothetical protein SpiGrapes_0813 [Sphaerochaeta pleomorpha str. Grapes]
MGQELGGFFGFLIIVLYGLTVLNYIVKWVNKRYGASMKTHEKGYSVFKKCMKIVIRNHKLFGLLTVVFLLTHFFIQFNQYGISMTGVVAAGVMVLQVLLGLYGFLTKNKGKGWLLIHRSIAVILLLSILSHLILAF